MGSASKAKSYHACPVLSPVPFVDQFSKEPVLYVKLNVSPLSSEVQIPCSPCPEFAPNTYNLFGALLLTAISALLLAPV